MEALDSLLCSAASGDTAAYDRIVSRFRDMAYSYAYSILRDFHLAEDATQEAFLQALYDLPKLREPQAFPGWLRRIVFRQCDRLTRRKHVPVVPLEEAAKVPARGAGPEERAEVEETRAAVLAAIGALPDREREVVLLFYIRDYSQREVADFLQVPITTVNSRLQEARKRLKGMMEMVRRTLREYQLPEDFRVTITRPSATQTAAPGLVWFHDRWVLVWQDGLRGDPYDYAFRFLLSESRDGKQWSEPRQVDMPPQMQQMPRLCVVGEELVMHTHDWHRPVRITRTRDLRHWSSVLLPLGDTGRGGPFTRRGILYLAYARWCGIDSLGDAVEVIASADGIAWRWLSPPRPHQGTGIVDAVGLGTEDRLYAFWHEHKHGDNPEPAAYANWSEDDGVTWSQPVRVDPLSPPRPARAASPQVAAFTPDGRLVVAGEVWDDDGGAEVYLAISPDRGQTWPEQAVIPGRSLIHTALAFAPDGTLLIAGSTTGNTSTRPVVLHSRLEGA